YVHGDGAASVRDAIEGERLDGLIVVGGDGTLRSALALWEEGVPLVGVPKTIDNDTPGTDVTFGFDTAMQIATEAIDRITTTAESHDRVMVVEVMGRTCGWIATYAGVAAGGGPTLRPRAAQDPAGAGGARGRVDPRARGALWRVGAGRAAARPRRRRPPVLRGRGCRGHRAAARG